MKTTTDTSAPDPRTQVKKKNALTAGQKPAWTWIAVLVGALALAAVATAVLSGGFNWPGFVILTGVFYVIAMYIVTLVVENRRRATDGLWKNLVWGAFLIALLPLISVIWTVVGQGLPTLLANPHMLWVDMGGVTGASDQATVNEGEPLMGGFFHGLVGSVAITAIATLISVPIGLMASIYLVEYSRGGWFSRAITFFVDVMTGIPSIVAGLFAFSLFGTIAAIVNPGAIGSAKTGIAAAVALSVLMIPVVVRNTEEILRLVPMDLREATYALGVPKWKTIVRIVLPTAISGILSGITIAIARVIGETAPIMVTAGFAKNLNWDLFAGWMSTLPTYIYDSQMRPVSPGVAAAASSERAWAAALVLIIIVMLLNLIARLIAKALAPKAGR